jgi:hypothetical protein
MLLSALRSSCSFIFVRLLEGDQLNVCVCVCVCARVCVRALHNVSCTVSRILQHLNCCNLWHNAQTWQDGDLHFQNAGRFCRNVRQCNFTDSRKKSVAFPLPIFKEVTIVQGNNVQISCTEFHSNRTKNVGSTNTNSSTPVSQRGYWHVDFPETCNQSVTNCRYLPYRVVPKYDEKHTKWGKYSFTPSKRVQLSPHSFLRSSLLYSRFNM